MIRIVVCLLLAVFTGLVSGAEIHLDFSEFPLNRPPTGFRSAVSGEPPAGGKHSDPEWKIILDEVTPLIAPLTPNAPAVSKQHVLAQLSQDPRDERFPMLIYEAEEFYDFTLTTRFKTVSGEKERMAGIAFRIQDENNFYVVRASSLGNTFRFYKVVNGLRTPPIGPEIAIPSGVWHELSVECKGNQIFLKLNGKEAMPALTDNSFASGKVGFWTKSDSVSYFADTKITFTPRIPLAQMLVKNTYSKFSRLEGLKIFSTMPDKEGYYVIGSTDESELGKPAEKVAKDCVENAQIFYAKTSKEVMVTMPLRDRNGDVVAAVRVIMKPFIGQTQNNALARALPVVKIMEKQVKNKKDLIE